MNQYAETCNYFDERNKQVSMCQNPEVTIRNTLTRREAVSEASLLVHLISYACFLILSHFHPEFVQTAGNRD